MGNVATVGLGSQKAMGQLLLTRNVVGVLSAKVASTPSSYMCPPHLSWFCLALWGCEFAPPGR